MIFSSHYYLCTNKILIHVNQTNLSVERTVTIQCRKHSRTSVVTACLLPCARLLIDNTLENLFRKILSISTTRRMTPGFAALT